MPRGRRRYLIWGGVLLAFAGVFWWVLHEKKSGTGRMTAGPVTVVAATALLANMPVYLDAIGTVTPVHTALITSQVTGLVRTVHYEEGPDRPPWHAAPRDRFASLSRRRCCRPRARSNVTRSCSPRPR